MIVVALLGVLPGLEGTRPYLLATQFDAWHGFLRVPADWQPIGRAAWVCALYVAVPLTVAYVVFLTVWFWGTRERRSRVGRAARS